MYQMISNWRQYRYRHTGLNKPGLNPEFLKRLFRSPNWIGLVISVFFSISLTTLNAQTYLPVNDGQLVQSEQNGFDALQTLRPDALDELQELSGPDMFEFYQMALSATDYQQVINQSPQQIERQLFPIANLLKTNFSSRAFAKSLALETQPVLSGCQIDNGIIDSQDTIHFSINEDHLINCALDPQSDISGYLFEVQIDAAAGSGTVNLNTEATMFPKISRASELDEIGLNGRQTVHYQVPGLIDCTNQHQLQCSNRYTLQISKGQSVYYNIVLTDILTPGKNLKAAGKKIKETPISDFINGNFNNFGTDWSFSEHEAASNCSGNIPGQFVNNSVPSNLTFANTGNPAPSALRLGGVGSGSPSLPQREWSQLSQTLQLPNGNFENFEVNFDYRLFTGAFGNAGAMGYRRVNFFVTLNNVTTGNLRRVFSTSFIGSGQLNNAVLSTDWINNATAFLGDDLAGHTIDVRFVTCDTLSNGTGNSKGASRLDNIELTFSPASAPNPPTGTLSSDSPCTIPVGQTTCTTIIQSEHANTPLSCLWRTTAGWPTQLIDCTVNNNTTRSYEWPFSQASLTSTFDLRAHNSRPANTESAFQSGTLLDSISVTGQNAAGSATGTLSSDSPCTIPSGQTTCTVVISSTHNNTPLSCLWRTTPGAPIARVGCTFNGLNSRTYNWPHARATQDSTFDLRAHDSNPPNSVFGFNSGTLLDSISVSGQTSNSTPTGQLDSDSPCTLDPGQTTCTVVITSTHANTPLSCLWRTTPGAPAAIVGCTFNGLNSRTYHWPHARISQASTFDLRAHDTTPPNNSIGFNSGTRLDSLSVSAQASNAFPTGQLDSDSPCTVPPGQTTCTVVINSTHSNTPLSCLWRTTPGTSVAIVGCTFNGLNSRTYHWPHARTSQASTFDLRAHDSNPPNNLTGFNTGIFLDSLSVQGQ